jgi:hypothetical protein
MATVMLKSCVLAWERPLTPGTLLVTVKFCEMIPALPILYQNVELEASWLFTYWSDQDHKSMVQLRQH